jgi:hypothetical protein
MSVTRFTLCKVLCKDEYEYFELTGFLVKGFKAESTKVVTRDSLTLKTYRTKLNPHCRTSLKNLVITHRVKNFDRFYVSEVKYLCT